MDNLQEQLVANLPPGVLEHVTSHSATYWSLYQRFMTFQSAFRTHFLAPLETYVISPILASISAKPDLATVAILVVILFVSLKILNMLYQTVIWWISLFLRLAFWTVILSVGLWIWQRGFGGAMTDAEAWKDEWTKQYQYWQRQEMHARHAQGIGVAGTRGPWWTGR
ncbi:MAG: hypothetical protein Q9159_005111 [Coniocarpon cinnabarinum]